VHLDGRASEGLAQVREALVRCLQLDYPHDEIEALAAEDRVLAAVLKHCGRGGGKLYPDLFEALCGVVCAQRSRGGEAGHAAGPRAALGTHAGEPWTSR
jgi:hypothetical protein